MQARASADHALARELFSDPLLRCRRGGGNVCRAAERLHVAHAASVARSARWRPSRDRSLHADTAGMTLLPSAEALAMRVPSSRHRRRGFTRFARAPVTDRNEFRLRLVQPTVDLHRDEYVRRIALSGNRSRRTSSMLAKQYCRLALAIRPRSGRGSTAWNRPAQNLREADSAPAATVTAARSQRREWQSCCSRGQCRCHRAVATAKRQSRERFLFTAGRLARGPSVGSE